MVIVAARCRSPTERTHRTAPATATHIARITRALLILITHRALRLPRPTSLKPSLCLCLCVLACLGGGRSLYMRACAKQRAPARPAVIFIEDFEQVKVLEESGSSGSSGSSTTDQLSKNPVLYLLCVLALIAILLVGSSVVMRMRKNRRWKRHGMFDPVSATMA